jgi:hypothetical protein
VGQHFWCNRLLLAKASSCRGESAERSAIILISVKLAARGLEGRFAEPSSLTGITVSMLLKSCATPRPIFTIPSSEPKKLTQVWPFPHQPDAFVDDSLLDILIRSGGKLVCQREGLGDLFKLHS